MRTILVIALFAGAASIAAAQDTQHLRDNPVIFQQPEEPPWPQQPPPPPEARQEQAAPVPAPAPPPENERENVSGREEADQHQRLFDQWSAPGQARGGTATIRIVE